MLVVDDDACYWLASDAVKAMSLRGGEPRIVAGEVSSLLLADAGERLVATDGEAILAVDKKTGTVTPLAGAEFGVTGLCVACGRVFWTATAVIRACPLAGGPPTTLLIADSPRAKFATTASSLATDGSHLYWAQIGQGEIVRATLDGEHREYLAIGEELPGRLQTTGGFAYWSTQPRSGPTQIRRVGDRVETVLEAAHVNAFAVDGDLIYWTDAFAGTLQRTPLSGGDHELLLSDLDNPLALQIVDGWAYVTSGLRVLRIHAQLR